MRFILAIMVVSAVLLPASGAQAKSARRAGNAVAASAAEASTPPAQAAHSTAAADEQQALRDDLKRMRALVQQMETNLAFVDSSQTPLKHQFQLEIDMWRTLINQMERRLQGSSR